MIKTKDGYKIEVGMWIEDKNGIYEVFDIDKQFIHLFKVMSTEDNDIYIYGEYKRLLKSKAEKMYIWKRRI